MRHLFAEYWLHRYVTGETNNMTPPACSNWRTFVGVVLVLLCMASTARAQDLLKVQPERPANQSILIASKSASSDQGVPARNYALGGAGAIVGGGLVIAGGIRVIRGASDEEGFGGGIAEGAGYMAVLVGTTLVGGGIYLIVKALIARSDGVHSRAASRAWLPGWSLSPWLTKSRRAGLRLSVAL